MDPPKLVERPAFAAEAAASADSAEEMKDTTTVRRWRLHAEAIGRESGVSSDVGEDEAGD